MAAGRRVEGDRVVAIEQRLARLDATARDETGRMQAGTLRAAERECRARLGALDTVLDAVAGRKLLQAAAVQLEAALAIVDPLDRSQDAAAR
ncbi:MAG TPA: hypothetical protein VE442_06580 [Jatrophihabitans sp.]|nr:hypothetical protein [Jatrophihabitans sp.]